MRGERRLYVSSTSKIAVNTWVRLLMDNVNGTLVTNLHGGLLPGDPQFFGRDNAVMFNFKVTEVWWCTATHHQPSHPQCRRLDTCACKHVLQQSCSDLNMRTLPCLPGWGGLRCI